MFWKSVVVMVQDIVQTIFFSASGYCQFMTYVVCYYARFLHNVSKVSHREFFFAVVAVMVQRSCTTCDFFWN